MYDQCILLFSFFVFVIGMFQHCPNVLYLPLHGLTGKLFPEATRFWLLEGKKKKYCNPYWITREHLDWIGGGHASIRPGQEPTVLPTEGNSFFYASSTSKNRKIMLNAPNVPTGIAWYNAEQTTNAPIINEYVKLFSPIWHSESYQPVDAFTGGIFLGPSRERLQVAAARFQVTNEQWISKKDLPLVDDGSVKPLDDVRGVSVRLCDTYKSFPVAETGTEIGKSADALFYNALHTTQPHKLYQHLKKRLARTVLYRRIYGAEIQRILQHYAHQKNFKSRDWITSKKLYAAYGERVKLLPGATGVRLPLCCNEAFTETVGKYFTLYNAQETTDPALLIRCSNRGPMVRLSDGMSFSSGLQLALHTEAEKRGYKSPVWTDDEGLERTFKGHVKIHCGEQPFLAREILTCSEGRGCTQVLFNADQTTDAETVQTFVANTRKRHATERSPMRSAYRGTTFPHALQRQLYSFAARHHLQSRFWLHQHHLEHFSPKLVLSRKNGPPVVFILPGNNFSRNENSLINVDQIENRNVLDEHIARLRL